MAKEANQRGVILITGSSGFIGSALIDLLREHYQVIGIDRDEPKRKIPDVVYYKIDITSHDDVQKTLREVRRNHGEVLCSVIHLVAYYSFSGEEDLRYQSITVDGTKFLIRALSLEFMVEQFIFSSSMLVYRKGRLGETINENSPVDPAWAYPKSKVEAEKVLKEEHGAIPVINLRIAGVYDDSCHSPTISQQLIRINEMWASSVLFPGDPDHGQSFLHLEDLAEATKLLVDNRKRFRTFENIVLGEETFLSYRELQARAGELLHDRPWPVVRVPAFIAKLGARTFEVLPFMREPFIKPWMIKHSDDHFALDIGRMKRFLHWQPQRSLETTLPKMVESLRHNPEAWYEANKAKKPFYRRLDLIGTPAEGLQWMAMIMNVFLGLWLLSNPFSFGSIEGSEALSEIVSGVLVTILSTCAIVPTLRWLRWPVALLGFWIMLSPLVFDTASPAAYSGSTLLGALIMIAAVFTPATQRSAGYAIPPGWSYNPSTAGQRLPIMLLAFLGYLFSRYMASYQLGHISDVWDPFFGEQTSEVLRSSVSKAFPVSDAGLGALTYLLDLVAASIGGRDRWRRQPWAVILFGLMIIPAGATSITLIMLQPISVGAWCFFCLLTAVIMLIMVPPAIDEVLASIQYLLRVRQEGKSLWQHFWFGGPEEFAPQLVSAPRPVTQGSTLPLVLALLTGVWLMLTPEVYSLQGKLANSIYIAASLVVTFAFIAFSEIARPIRLLNVPTGFFIAGLPWVLNTDVWTAQWSLTASGIALVILSLPRGRIAQHFGSADRLAHWSPFDRRFTVSGPGQR